MFRQLTDEEEMSFKEWTHHNWKEELPQNFDLFHPVVQAEWKRIDNEKDYFQCDVCGEVVCRQIIDTVYVYGVETLSCASCRDEGPEDLNYDPPTLNDIVGDEK